MTVKTAVQRILDYFDVHGVEIVLGGVGGCYTANNEQARDVLTHALDFRKGGRATDYMTQISEE